MFSAVGACGLLNIFPDLVQASLEKINNSFCYLNDHLTLLRVEFHVGHPAYPPNYRGCKTFSPTCK